MNARTYAAKLRHISKTVAVWLDVNTERLAWTVTLNGEDTVILAPLGCAAQLEAEGFTIVASPAEQVTASELHARSIHFYGHAIRHFDNEGRECWSLIDAVHVSAHQGVDIRLSTGETLQACFPETATYWITK